MFSGVKKSAETSEIMEVPPDHPFYFDCRAEVPCFNHCCRDLNQVLTPYDVARLRHHLGMSSTAFLDRFARRQIGSQTGLPVVTLRPLGPPEQACPFVTPSGCRVYPDRPSSCRMYPVFRVAARQRDTGGISERFLLIREPHCRGFDRGRQWTVREWMKNQELERYNRANDDMLALISVKNQRISGVLDDRARQWIYTACYDIDRFREAMLAGEIPSGPEKEMPLPPHAADDFAWLSLGMAFVRREIFGETPEVGYGFK